jgi:teichuronic acid exporter
MNLSLIKNKFIKDVLTLVSGTVFGQIIIFLFTPLITRIYSPEYFGVYAIYIGFSSILAIFTTGRYEFAIILPKSYKKSENILKLIFGIGAIVSFFYLSIVFLYFFFGDIVSSNYQYFIENKLYLIPVSTFIACINSGLYYMAQRKKMYNVSAVNSVFQNISTVFINIIFGLIVSLNYGLILGLIVGQLLSTIFLFYKLKYNTSIFNLDFKVLLLTAKEYVNFPKYMLVSDLATISSQQLPPIIFSLFFNNIIVGNFSLANRILRIPAIVLTSSVANVFRNEAIEEIRIFGNCNKIYKFTILRLTIISVIVFSFASFISPYIFEILLGKEWEIAGKMAQIISIMMIFDFIALPFNSLYYILKKQKIYMWLQTVNTLFSLIMLFFGEYFFDSYMVSIILFSISNSLFNIINIVMTFQMSRKKYE